MSRITTPRLLGTILAFGLAFSVYWIVSSSRKSQELHGSSPLGGNPHDGVLDATTIYLGQLDLKRWERQGTDYTNPRMSPLRIGKPVAELDMTYDYDFPRLAETERRLENVDRRTVLKVIFQRLCYGAATNTEKHLRVLRFLHKATMHNRIQPVYADRSMVMDPLVLLELGESRCGQVSRIAVDLFEVGGFPGRLVQLGSHVSSEIYYDDAWHLFEADIFGNGETPVLPDGRIPSLAELSEQPHLLDGLTAYGEPDYRNSLPLNSQNPYPAVFYFSRCRYRTPPLFYVKTATPEEARGSRYYGWNYYQSVLDSDRPLRADMKVHHIPAAPWLEHLYLERIPAGLRVFLSWEPSKDPDGDLLGYQVLVSRQGRGWGYDGPSLPPHLMPYKSHPNGWRPEHYEKRFTRPACEVFFGETDGTSIDLTLPDMGRYYISVMPFDAHGKRVGRKLFPLSEEVTIDCKAVP